MSVLSLLYIAGALSFYLMIGEVFIESVSKVGSQKGIPLEFKEILADRFKLPDPAFHPRMFALAVYCAWPYILLSIRYGPDIMDHFNKKRSPRVDDK